MTGAGFISRILGFFYRIFLSQTIGASGLGLYQLIFPVFTLCLAIAASGIQTSISRYVAIDISKGRQGHLHLWTGIGISGSLSVILMLLLQTYAPVIASDILKEPRTEPLLQVLAFAFFPACIHACFNGYYYGKKESVVPSVCQITEQLVRIASTLIFYQILLEKGQQLQPIHAVWGLVLSELAGLLLNTTIYLWKNGYIFIKLRQHLHGITLSTMPFYPLVSMAFPLTLNHVLMTLSHSLENLLIPQQLIVYGYSSDEALAHFGVLTGMALSVIFFPSALTNSLSVLLLPRISEAKASNNHCLVMDTIKGALGCGITLGSLCTFIFLLSGQWLGNYLFEEPLAGFYIQILSILCPFLYSASLLSSIVTGLGFATLTLICNLCGCAVRIIAIWFFLPIYGMYAYILATIASYILITLLFIIILYRTCKRNYLGAGEVI